MFESQILIDILNKNNINSYPGGTDKASAHSYTGSYERLLSPYLQKENVNLLEIGVHYGGSSLLWHDYLQQSKLYLVDILDQRIHRIAERLNKDRIHFYEMDAYSFNGANLLSQECPDGYDIIIDDGPHTLESMIFCITHYLPLLRKDGVMVIEDLQDISWASVLTSFVPPSLQDSIEVLDLRHHKNRYDDILFVVKKTTE